MVATKTSQKNILPVLILLVALSSTSALIIENLRNQRLSKGIDDLNDQVSQLQNARANSALVADLEIPMPPLSKTPTYESGMRSINVGAKDSATTANEPAESTFEMKAHEYALIAEDRVEDLEGKIALSAEQRRRLQAKFATEKALGASFLDSESLEEDSEFSKQSGTESLTDILGLEQFEKYKKAFTEEQTRRAEDRKEGYLFFLSRKLSLSKDQEAFIRSAMDEVELSIDGQKYNLRQRMKKLTSVPLGREVTKEQMDQEWQEIQALKKGLMLERQKLLNEQLKGTLTDEQSKKLLDLQQQGLR